MIASFYERDFALCGLFHNVVLCFFFMRSFLSSPHLLSSLGYDKDLSNKVVR